jgi:hypothetical protein
MVTAGATKTGGGKTTVCPYRDTRLTDAPPKPDDSTAPGTEFSDKNAGIGARSCATRKPPHIYFTTLA